MAIKSCSARATRKNPMCKSRLRKTPALRWALSSRPPGLPIWPSWPLSGTLRKTRWSWPVRRISLARQSSTPPIRSPMPRRRVESFYRPSTVSVMRRSSIHTMNRGHGPCSYAATTTERNLWFQKSSSSSAGNRLTVAESLPPAPWNLFAYFGAFQVSSAASGITPSKCRLTEARRSGIHA